MIAGINPFASNFNFSKKFIDNQPRPETPDAQSGRQEYRTGIWPGKVRNANPLPPERIRTRPRTAGVPVGEFGRRLAARTDSRAWTPRPLTAAPGRATRRQFTDAPFSLGTARLIVPPPATLHLPPAFIAFPFPPGQNPSPVSTLRPGLSRQRTLSQNQLQPFARSPAPRPPTGRKRF